MKQRPLACQAPRKSGGNLPELGRCRVVRAEMGQPGGQRSLCCYGDFSHQSPLPHRVRGKEEFQGDKGDGLRGDPQEAVCDVDREAGWAACTVSRDHTAGKMCELQKNFCGGSLAQLGAAFN